jgi:hypothetical protein
VDVAIITSLYRSAGHLAGFLEQLETCMRSVESHGHSAESIIVSNAPDRSEQRILRGALGSPWWAGHTRLLVVPRETLYASWNRGVDASSGSAIAFWNVDDYRNPAALTEGIELVRKGCELVSFPYLFIAERRLGRSRTKRTVVLEDREKLMRMDPGLDFCLGPFFMFDRRLFDEIGPFDEQFHIVGDYDWQLRAVRHTSLEWGEPLGGVFFADGTNLCDTGSPRQLAEQNILIERHGLDRAEWPLDDRAAELFAGYRIPLELAGGHAPDWSYDRYWRRRRSAERIYRRSRRLASAPIRLARSWRQGPR